jgi:hypothetical protein
LCCVAGDFRSALFANADSLNVGGHFREVACNRTIIARLPPDRRQQTREIIPLRLRSYPSSPRGLWFRQKSKFSRYIAPDSLQYLSEGLNKKGNKIDQPLHMKAKIISKMLLSLSLAFVLASSITHVYGDVNPPPPCVVTIHSLGDVTRRETGLFTITMTSAFRGAYVNFSVSGTAVPGVDYVPLVSPAPIVPFWGSMGIAFIPVETLRNLRWLFIPRAFDIVVTLEPGPGYAVGEPRSAQMTIEPLSLTREIPRLPRPSSTSSPRP